MATLILLGLICLLSFGGSDANLAPRFVADMNGHLLPESSPVQSSVYQLQGEDPEGTPLRYGILNSDTFQVDPNTGVVTLLKKLDRETQLELRLNFTLVDDDPSNLIVQRVVAFVLDENDTPPRFSGLPYELRVPESTEAGELLANFTVFDGDLVNGGLVVTCEDNAGAGSCDKIEIQQDERYPTLSGQVFLRKRVRYDEGSVFPFRLVAFDGAHQVVEAMTLVVEDVQDKPPEFVGSLSGSVVEDAPPGTKILQLSAIDGDRGFPRKLKYFLLDKFGMDNCIVRIIDGPVMELHFAYVFSIDSAVVGNANKLFLTQAREVVGETTLEVTDAQTFANVSVTIQDVNDEPPKFSQREFQATIPENATAGTPLVGLDIRVSDTDNGPNSVFNLALEDPSGSFSLEPSRGVGAVAASIRLTKTPLDYEDPNQRKFVLVLIAREQRTTKRLSSTASVIVSVVDVNDNRPRFPQPLYSATISESSQAGTIVATVAATDADSGDYGVPSLRYSLSGEGSRLFKIDEKTGVVEVASCSSPGLNPCLDFETKSNYYLDVEVADEFGSGLKAVVPLLVNLADSNDNPPVFELKKYVARIRESEKEFKPTLKVDAPDADVTSEVKYQLVTPGGDAQLKKSPLELFGIDSRTGKITVTDQDAGIILPSHMRGFKVDLMVRASDGVHEDVCEVEIEVEDTNNNEPVFERSRYEITLPEISEVGSVVAEMKAVDADVGRNAEVFYRMDSGTFGDFDIAPENGTVTLKRKLDYERRPVYNMSVLSIDHGTPPLTGTAMLIVTVIGTKDILPTIVNPIQRVTVNEDARPGEPFAKIETRGGEAGQWEFRIVRRKIVALMKDGHRTDGARNPFVLDPHTGELSISAEEPLNRDQASFFSIPYEVVIPKDERTENDYPLIEGMVQVTIVDVNDNPPVFENADQSGSYDLKVKEGLPKGTPVHRFLAVDKESAISKYELMPAEGSPEFFVIDEFTGQMFTGSTPLDFETQETVAFEVKAYDSGIPELSSVLKVTVRLVNTNDEAPVFSEKQYEVQLRENSPRSAPVAMVKATDADKGEFGSITYGLAGAHARDFQIDASGTITVVNSALLDRETTPMLTVHATASDGVHTTTVPVILTLTDENDNPPMFSRREYVVTVEDKIPVESPAIIVRVEARDPDVGAGGDLRYSIVSGNVDEAFQLDPVKGYIRPSGKHPLWNLPSKPEIVELKVRVRDEGGNGPFFDETLVRIYIKRSNQHRPVFLRPNSANPVVEIPENVDVPRPVIHLLAEDADGNETANGRVSYHLKTGSENVQRVGPFNLDELTGELTLEKQLDREEADEYKLIVVAKDGGGPFPYESLLPLTVVVNDINDNEPAFERKSRSVVDLSTIEVEGRSTFEELDRKFTYTFEITEGEPVGALVGMLEAKDPDSGKNARIFYHIVAQDHPGKPIFAVDLTKGLLVARKVLDREARDSYELAISATNTPEVPVDLRNVTYQQLVSGEKAADPSVAFVRIVVKDLNDNEPKFGKRKYFAAIPVKAEVGYSFLTLKAKDPDFSLNGTLSYRIRSSNLHRIGSNESLGSVVPSPFAIDNRTGELTTSILVEEFRNDWFVLEIGAREVADPQRTAVCFVEVWFYKEEQAIKVVMARPPEEVATEEVQGGVVGELSRLSGSQLVPAGLRYHVDQYNHLQTSWTDLAVVAVNPQKRMLVDVSAILRSVDVNYDFLRQHYADYSIENVVPAVEPVKLENEELKPVEILLIALILIFIIGLITAISVCCCLRHWVPKEPKDSPEKIGIIPMHSDPEPISGTTNPLWLGNNPSMPFTPSKIYEEQELTMQVSPGPDNSPNRNGAPSPTDAQSNAYATIDHEADTSRENADNSRDTASHGHPEDGLYLGEYATLRDSPSFRVQGPRIPGMGSGFPYGEDSSPSWMDRSYSGPISQESNMEPVIVAELLE